MKAIVSIDPGRKGFLTYRNGSEMDYYAIVEGDMLGVAQKMREWRERCDEMVVVMEEVHAVFGSSAKATFAFGEVNGFLKGVVTAMGVPYVTVQPKVWQREVWVTQDMVYDTKEGKDGKPKKVVNTKETSHNAARRLFPGEDLRRNKKCKGYDDNKVDSLLIGEYGRRKNL